MENKPYDIEQQSAAAQQQRQRRNDVYNLDELSDAIASQPPRQAAQQTQEEEKQVDYGDQFDYRAGRNTVAGNQPSAQAASNGIEAGGEPGVDRQASLNIGTAIQLIDDTDAAQ